MRGTYELGSEQIIISIIITITITIKDEIHHISLTMIIIKTRSIIATTMIIIIRQPFRNVCV